MKRWKAASLIMLGLALIIVCMISYTTGYQNGSTGEKAREIFREGYEQGQMWGFAQGYDRAIVDAGEAMNRKG